MFSQASIIMVKYKNTEVTLEALEVEVVYARILLQHQASLLS